MNTKISALAGVAVGVVMFALPAAAVFADTLGPINFESPTYTTGNINGQNGWVKTGAFDATVIGVSTPASFASQSLQISNAVTSGTFGDQTFSPSLANEAGETDALNGGESGGTRQPHFEAQFDLMPSTPGSGQTLSVSPDRGDGARMSYLRFEDQADGVHVFFDDVTDPGHTTGLNVVNFNEVQIATLTNTAPHTIKFSMDFLNGPDNDIVNIYIDNTLVHTGTSWEDYYRFDSESNPTLADNSRTVDSLLFRESGTQNAANAGKGFLIDNLSLESGPIASTSTTVVVNPANMHGWSFIDDQTNGAGTGVMVTGPSTPPLSTGSAQLTTANATDGQILAELGYAGTKLSSLTTLKYSTYQDAANPSTATAIALQFNVDKDVTDADNSYQGRVVFEPYLNNGGSVPLGSWSTWDALNGGNAVWWLSHASTQFSNNCSQSAPCTLSQLIALYPNIGINPSPTLGAVVLKAGSGWASFKGSADALTIGVDSNNTTFDFEPTVTAAPLVTVTIDKFIDGAMATAQSANNAAFPMVSSWVTTNFPSGSGSYTLSSSGFNSANPYEAVTAQQNSGSSYTTNEVTNTPVVSASCDGSAPFALAGYSTGTSEADAASAPITQTIPSFTNITQNEFVTVHNISCVANLPAPVNVSPVNGTILTTSQWTKADWTDVTDQFGPITYLYESSNSSATNLDGSFVSPAFQSGALTVSEIPTPGTSAGTWFWHARAVDAAHNMSPWSAATEVIVDNSAPAPIAMCPVGTVKQLVETVAVNSASATPTQSLASLTAGKQYLLDSTGTWQNSSLNVADTAFASVDNFVTHMMGYNIAPYFLGPNEFQLQVDNAFAAWGGYQPTHEYSMLYTGTGSPVKLGVFDGDSNTNTANAGWYGDNSGNLSVNVYSCVVPPPPADACNNPTHAPAGYTIVNGTSGNDNVTLPAFGMFVGKGGNDKVTAIDGQHIVCLGTGNGTVTLGNGDNVVVSAGGNNNIKTGNGVQVIATGSGNDTITIGTGASTISAGEGNNTVKTGDGDQRVTSGSGNDSIVTGAGNDTINAGGGNNAVNSGAGNDSITTGSGNDSVVAGGGTNTCSLGGGNNTKTGC